MKKSSVEDLMHAIETVLMLYGECRFRSREWPPNQRICFTGWRDCLEEQRIIRRFDEIIAFATDFAVPEWPSRRLTIQLTNKTPELVAVIR
jgi:hypothetical protein